MYTGAPNFCILPRHCYIGFKQLQRGVIGGCSYVRSLAGAVTRLNASVKWHAHDVVEILLRLVVVDL